jgi:prepilin-type processing-associated H-X9-DG protein
MPIRRADALATGAIIALTLSILVPVAAQTAADSLKAREISTLSNAKQLGLALMMYCQDYDETYAPAIIDPSRPDSSSAFSRAEKSGWAVVTMPYIKSRSVYLSPGVMNGKQVVQFMYNDLASSASLAAVAAPANSVLLMDGEDVACNSGHAWNKNTAPVGATAVKSLVAETVRGKKIRKTLWRVAPGAGARVQTSPTRFGGKGVYCFLDGHAKVYPPQAIFFPPRASSSTKSLAGEPKLGERGVNSFRLN